MIEIQEKELEMMENTIYDMEEQFESVLSAVKILDQYIGNFNFSERPSQKQLENLYTLTNSLYEDLEEVRSKQDLYILPEYMMGRAKSLLVECSAINDKHVELNLEMYKLKENLEEFMKDG